MKGIFLYCAFFIFISCQKRTPIKYLEQELIKIDNSFSAKTIIFISDTDCSSCLESLALKIKTLKKPVIGIFLKSQEKSIKSFEELINKTQNEINWSIQSNIQLSNALTQVWEGSPMPCFFVLENNIIIRSGKL